MTDRRGGSGNRSAGRQAGFTLLELMIALGILVAVSAIVLTLGFHMAMSQATMSNRTDLHASIRSVTETLQQEISQAGRVAWPDTVCPSTLLANQACPYIVSTAAVAVPAGSITVTFSLTVNDATMLFPGERLVIDTGCTDANVHQSPCEEVITIPADYVSGTTTVNNVVFNYSHNANVPVRPVGAFAEGILPTGNGNELKMFGDINSDGNMVLVEYICNPGTSAAPGDLRRIEVPWNAAAGSVTAATSEVLVNNLLANPGGVPCFSYQGVASGTQMNGLPCVGGTTGPNNCNYQLNVAVTLTAQTQFQDPQRHEWNENTRETKALLSVSPRNVFQAWQMANMPSGTSAPGQISGPLAHVQPTPETIRDLFLE